MLLTACGGGDDGGAAPAASEQPSSGGEQSSGGGLPSGGSGQDGGDTPSAKNTPPTIDGAPPPVVLHDDTYSFQPQAQDADGDVLSFSVANAPPWAQFEPATGRLEGTPAAGDVGTYENIVISVTDGAADASLNAFSITVSATAEGSMELSWMAPTENEDGTPLTDLAGYKVYWGTEPGNYTESVTIDNPSIVTYVIDNLVPNTYYFVATAVNAAGEESEYSEEAVGTVS
ncbi:MAG: fibronectin type III domain-containing protein [Gammaproteobacteria bacterium]|nr:fibronectin type III domain-containing protein [Gammaproteobacteria bacterium]